MSRRTTKKYRDIYERHHKKKIGADNHIHHIDGNSNNNDISNLIELTLEEHALAHLDLYEKTGELKHKIAYSFLSGKIKGITEKERKELAKEGQRQYLKTEKWLETKEKIRRANMGKKLSDEHKEKIKKSIKKKIEDGMFSRRNFDKEERRNNFLKNREKIVEGRRNSQKWKDSVTNDEHRALQRNKMMGRENTWGDKVSASKRGKKTKSTIEIIINGVLYPSISEASRVLNISEPKLRRLHSKFGKFITV